MHQEEPEIFYPDSRAAWRKWLEKNHLSQQSVWVVFYAKKSGKKSITWSEAVDEALCFGWIDSKKIKIDKETSHQFFSKRKAHSTWSRINKVKVEQLTDSGQMTAAGYESIAIAKKNGSWTILDDVEALIIPNDLGVALNASPGATNYFMSLSKSARKAILQWLTLAKRPETRHKRLVEIMERAEQKLKPKHLP